jgi:CRISPR-associated protein Csm2
MTQARGSRPGGQTPGGQASGGYDRNGGGRRQPDQTDQDIVQALTSTGKIDFWSGGNRPTLRPDLLDHEAQARAKALREVPSSQLRRFYGPTVAFKQRLRIDSQINESEVKAQVAYLKASSAYAGARKQPKALVEFFVAAANSVKTREDYLAFAQHFEAVMAFHKVFENKGTER